MQCAFPVTLHYGQVVGCGQCMPCRVDKQRMKALRVMLENRCHGPGSFLTLTYDQDHVPLAVLNGIPTPILVKRHARQFLDSFKYRWGSKFRYMLVGEYGDRTWRPHYHVALFGVNPIQLLHHQKVRRTSDGHKVHSPYGTWKYGNVDIGALEDRSCKYIAHYTTKKMTRANHRLEDRPPEFSWSSRKPAIGAPYLDQLEEWHYTPDGAKVLAETGDIIPYVNIGRTTYKLDPFLRRQLRGRLGVPLLKRDRPEQEEQDIGKEEREALVLQAQDKHDKLFRQAKRQGQKL